MGFIKDVKTSTAASHAARAIQEGRSVFLYRMAVPVSNPKFSAPVSGAAEVIESVERQGWHLQEMAFDGGQSANGGMLLLFRRSPAA